MAEVPWVKWFAGDFLNGVAELSPEQGWVYTVILNRIYDEGGPIKDDAEKIARRCNMRVSSCAKALDGLAKAGKIVRDDGLISNPRCEKEIKSRRKVGEKSRENIRKRWENAAKTSTKTTADPIPANNGRNTDPIPTRSQKPEARNRDSSGSSGDLDQRAAAEANEQVGPEPYLALGQWIIETAGMSDDPRRHPLGIVRQWLADYGEDAIRAGVKAVIERPGQKRPVSLNYFADAIREAAAAPAEARMAYARSFTADFNERRWLEYLAEWSRGLPWPAPVIGPAPNEPGTLVWPELLDRYKARFGNLDPHQQEVA